MGFRTNLVKIRIKNKLTQKEMAESIGVRVQAYQAYEHGRAHPNFTVLKKIIDEYKIYNTYNFLFYEVDI
jgi:DNA-binding XRE family transcriptional regulator